MFGSGFHGKSSSSSIFTPIQRWLSTAVYGGFDTEPKSNSTLLLLLLLGLPELLPGACVYVHIHTTNNGAPLALYCPFPVGIKMNRATRVPCTLPVSCCVYTWSSLFLLSISHSFAILALSQRIQRANTLWQNEGPSRLSPLCNHCRHHRVKLNGLSTMAAGVVLATSTER